MLTGSNYGFFYYQQKGVAEHVPIYRASSPHLHPHVIHRHQPSFGNTPAPWKPLQNFSTNLDNIYFHVENVLLF